MKDSVKEVPIANSLEETFNKLKKEGYQFPDFSSAETINCVTDYAGDRECDDHYVYSFIYYDYKKSAEFERLITDLRNKEPEWKDSSFIEYKKLTKDKVRRRLLPELLNIANTLQGIIIVFYVDKKIKSFFAEKQGQVSNTLKVAGFGDWKPQIAEKLLEVLLIQSFFTSKFVSTKHKYFWYSDRDAINDEGRSRIAFVGKLLGHFLDSFEVYPAFTGYGTNLEDDNYFGDVMSIADLCSGATLEFYEEQIDADLVKVSSNEVLEWFAVDSPNLKKINLRLRLNDDGTQTLSIIEYYLKDK